MTPTEQQKRAQGRKVKGMLVTAGIKQVDIARSLRVSTSFVCHALRGQRVGHRVRRQIAKLLNRSVQELWPNNRAA